MKKFNTVFILLAAAFILPFFSQCNLNCIQASGKQVSEVRNTDAYSKIDASGAMQIFLKQSNQTSVSIEADENIMPSIKTEVRDKTLNIKTENNICNSGSIKIYLTSPEFEGIDASGAIEIANGGIIKSGDFALDFSGACKSDLNIDVDHLKTESSGASVISLKGRANNHSIDMSGAVVLKARDLEVQSYNIETSGACKLAINVVKELNVSSSGASVVEYKGMPAVINNDKSGAAQLKKVD